MVSNKNWFNIINCIFFAFAYQKISATTCGGIQSSTLNASRGLFLSESFHVETLPNLYQCAVMCLHFTLCKSVNFDRGTRKCYLHQHNTILDPFPDVIAPGSMYYIDIKDIPQSLGGVCGASNCSMYERCLPTSDEEYTCLQFIRGWWACHYWTPEERASIYAAGNNKEHTKGLCEAVEYRVYYMTSSLKPVGCGTCYCCSFQFRSDVM